MNYELEKNPIIKVSNIMGNYGQIKLHNLFLKLMSNIINDYFEMENNVCEKLAFDLKYEAEQDFLEYNSKSIEIVEYILNNYEKELGSDISVEHKNEIEKNIKSILMFIKIIKFEDVYNNRDLKQLFITLKKYIMEKSNLFVNVSIANNNEKRESYLENFKKFKIWNMLKN